MSRNIKIELELPEFEKELTISVNLRKDGEVISTSSLPAGTKTVISDNNSITKDPIWKQQPEDFHQYDCPPPAAPKKKKSSGNMMDADF